MPAERDNPFLGVHSWDALTDLDYLRQAHADDEGDLARRRIERLAAELLAAQSDECLLAFTYAYQGALGVQSERVAMARRAYEKALAASPSEKPGSEEEA